MDDFAARFANPRPSARMLQIVHGWEGDENAVSQHVERVVRQGYGGVVTNVQFYNGYVERPANWVPLKSAIGKLRQSGHVMWVYDEAGYPSGRASDIVLRDRPDLEVKGLMIARREVDGVGASVDVPPGTMLLAAAFPLKSGKIQLAGRVELTAVDGKVAWAARPGKWLLMVVSVGRLYDGTQIACSGAPEHTRYVGLLERDTGKVFIKTTHDRYAAELGSNLGQWFQSTFTDEPSTMAIFFNTMPYATLPWCADMATEFKRRRGHELLPMLPCLAADAGERTQRLRVDFYRTVTELMVERWWDPLQQWCKAHGLASGGHLLLEENIVHHVPLYGSAFEAFRHMDSTGIDCLTSDPRVPRFAGMAGMGSDVPWNAARFASSAAELGGKKMVMCEVSEFIQSMAQPPIKLTHDQYRGTWNRLILGGINVFTSYTGFAGWSEAEIAEANTTVGRCIEALDGGRRDSQVAVLMPTETVWSRFTPSDLWVEQASRECTEVERAIRAVSESLYAGRREFDYVDARALADGKVEDGALVSGGKRFRVVVLPECDTLPAAAWRKLVALKQAGGTVVMVGATPRNTLDAFPSRAALAAGRLLAAGPHGSIVLPTGQGAAVSGKIDRILAPEMTVASDTAPLRMTRRLIGGRKVWLVINDGPDAWSGTLSIPGTGQVEQWDTLTGAGIGQAPAGAVQVVLKPYASLVLRSIP